MLIYETVPKILFLFLNLIDCGAGVCLWVYVSAAEELICMQVDLSPNNEAWFLYLFFFNCQR